MTTFAEILKEYPDGQRSIEDFPQEMAFYGFVPPVRTATGALTDGDVLTAQWLNSIFRDCFRAQKQIGLFARADDINTAPAAPSTVGGTFFIKVGPLMMLVFPADSHGGTADVAFPGGAKFKGTPLVFALDHADPSSLVRPVVAAEATSNPLAGFYPRARNAATPGTEDPARGGSMTIIMIGEYADSVGTPPVLPANSTFAEYERVYPDGQTTWTSPSAEQWDKGFVPSYKSGANLVAGDALAANVLNFILCDLFRKGGRGRVVKYSQRLSDQTVITSDAFVIQVGALKFQMWKGRSETGGDRFAFPEPFRKGSEPFIAATQAPIAKSAPVTAIGGASIGQNTQDPGNRHAWTGRVLHWNAAATPVNDDGDVVFFAVGLGDRQVSLQRYYDSFAATVHQYPDGQYNTADVAPILDSGFKPPVRNADGSITAGSNVTAQEINTLLKLAYDDARAVLTPIGGQMVELNALNGWQGVENAKMWMAWKTITGITASQWSGGYKVDAPYPTKSTAKLFGAASDTAVSDHSIVALAPGVSTDKTVYFTAAKYAAPATLSQPTAIRVFLIGVKP